MEIQKDGDLLRLVLSRSETQVLRWALERASFIDTPPEQQSAILNFCARTLELLPRS
jgi:hypothetical protein